MGWRIQAVKSWKKIFWCFNRKLLLSSLPRGCVLMCVFPRQRICRQVNGSSGSQISIVPGSSRTHGICQVSPDQRSTMNYPLLRTWSGLLVVGLGWGWGTRWNSRHTAWHGPIYTDTTKYTLSIWSDAARANYKQSIRDITTQQGPGGMKGWGWVDGVRGRKNGIQD